MAHVGREVDTLGTQYQQLNVAKYVSEYKKEFN
jgi:hypothetical protein